MMCVWRCENKPQCQLNSKLLLQYLFVVMIMATERRICTLDAKATLSYRQPLPPAGRNLHYL